jgi:hypothetical protein
MKIFYFTQRRQGAEVFLLRDFAPWREVRA